MTRIKLGTSCFGALALSTALIACAAETAAPGTTAPGGTGALPSSGAAPATGGTMTSTGATGGTLTTGGTGGTVTTGGTGGGLATGGTGGMVAPFVPDVALPITVTDYFAPSGHMGAVHASGKMELQGITMGETCSTRAPGAAGACFRVDYQPQELTDNGDTWAAVAFQNPVNNWGEEQGLGIEAGATKIVVTAWTDTPGTAVSFYAGNVGTIASPYSDDLRFSKAEEELNTVTLTDTPTQYEIDLTSKTYTYVLGGFGWSAKATSLDPMTFYIDDIRWVKE